VEMQTDPSCTDWVATQGFWRCLPVYTRLMLQRGHIGGEGEKRDFHGVSGAGW